MALRHLPRHAVLLVEPHDVNEHVAGAADALRKAGPRRQRPRAVESRRRPARRAACPAGRRATRRDRSSGRPCRSRAGARSDCPSASARTSRSRSPAASTTSSTASSPACRAFPTWRFAMRGRSRSRRSSRPSGSATHPDGRSGRSCSAGSTRSWRPPRRPRRPPSCASRGVPLDPARCGHGPLHARREAKAHRLRMAHGRASADPRGALGAQGAPRLGADPAAHQAALGTSVDHAVASRPRSRPHGAVGRGARSTLERDRHLRARPRRSAAAAPRSAGGGCGDRLAAGRAGAAGARRGRVGPAGGGRRAANEGAGRVPGARGRPDLREARS